MPQMSSSVDTPVVTCTSCDVEVPLVFPARARTVVCNACGTQLDLDGPRAQVISSVSLSAHQPTGLIETGRVGRFGTIVAQVVGRMRMASSEGVRSNRWEDWIVATQDGRVVWIREEEGQYALLSPFEPSASV
ncbi:MAG: ribosomal protein S27E, partial [Kiritimatiellia bacterium]